MNAIILHPTAATSIPVTFVKAGRTSKAKAVRKPSEITVADLRLLLDAAGLRHTTKHTKPELRAMLQTGAYVRPAALDKQNAKRKAERLAKKQEA